jgi:transcription initiation factor IIE alpha subunit
MIDSFDKQKMLDVLIDPNISIIMAELENGEKDSVYIANKLQISENEMKDRLAYVIEHGFVIVKQDGQNTTFSVDRDKLDKIMEYDENFDGVINGLTELDQFLN